jgi:hypothetical protein
MTTPMSAERFADRFRFYSGQPQQQRGVQQLYAAIGSSDQGTAILDEQAPGPSPSVSSHPSRRLQQVAWIPAARRKPAWPGRRGLPRYSPATPTCW